ncbi:uncharacterized protein LOC128895828 [Hylaeus anthracinus]|uniref:uncharacterized protein LOC128895828 n=1 Tax=Hylaeus anthracinus TaxID=313031 RepID=UPI0023B96A91|nr:uncharacterized protein LOC128895828 [Hylaeus anthracinus]
MPYNEIDIHTQLAKANINTSIGRSLQESPIANNELNLIMEAQFPNHIQIFTDGSKMEDSFTTGAACVCPQLNRTITLSLNINTSVFTAECAAISTAIELANENREKSYAICSDSISALQAIDKRMFDHNTNTNIIQIKKMIKEFEEKAHTESSLNFIWIPAHQGIVGNELADIKAKEVSKSTKESTTFIPPSDLTKKLKEIMWQNAYQTWINEGAQKGKTYFEKLFKKSKKPWFYNRKLQRYTTSWVCRYRSNHYNLAASLTRTGITKDSKCGCGHELQDFNHILWNCPLYAPKRKNVIEKLHRRGYTPPFKAEELLQELNLTAIRIITEFLKENNLQI